MLKKLIQGLVFGAGFGIAFIAVLLVSRVFVSPHLDSPAPVRQPGTEETAKPVEQPESPGVAGLAEPAPSAVVSREVDNSAVESAEGGLQIPRNGGILVMSPMATAANAIRPNTYQLWLTRSGLWQITTNEEEAEVGKLPYPEEISMETINSLMHDRLGMTWGVRTATVSETDISSIKSKEESVKNSSLSGELQITEEGVVFVLPDPLGT